MSLEANIAELNSNFKTLIGLLSAGYIQQNAAPAPVKTSAPAPTTPAPTTSAKTEAPAATTGLDYEKDVKPKVLEVSSKKGRDACMAVLSKFGLASAKAAKPEQYADIIAACEEVLK